MSKKLAGEVLRDRILIDFSKILTLKAKEIV